MDESVSRGAEILSLLDVNTSRVGRRSGLAGALEGGGLLGTKNCVDGGVDVARDGRGGGSCNCTFFLTGATLPSLCTYAIDGIGGTKPSATVPRLLEEAVGGVEGGVGMNFGAGFLQLGSLFLPGLETGSGELMYPRAGPLASKPSCECEWDWVPPLRLLL